MAEEPKPKKKAHIVEVQMKPGEREGEASARTIISPTYQAACTLSYFHAAEDDFEAADLIKKLEEAVAETLKGKKLQESQRMLAAQALALDGIFNVLARMAAGNKNRNIQVFEVPLKLALRAQSQCRSTLEALNEIRNPKLANIVGQANISGGHQQVNNDIGPSRAKEIKNPPNELLEEKQYEQLDFGETAETGRKNQTVEAVGAVNRAKKRGRKSKGSA
jgi:hypothetical protein